MLSVISKSQFITATSPKARALPFPKAQLHRLASCLLLLSLLACRPSPAPDAASEPASNTASIAPEPLESAEALGIRTSPEHQAEIDSWHEGRIKRLQSEDGWLTLAGLGWLAEGDNLAGSHSDAVVQLPPGAPERVGSFRMKDGEVRFVPEPGVDLSLNGEVLSSAAGDREGENAGPEKSKKSLETPPLKSSRGQKPDVLAIGTLRLHLMDFGTRQGIRVRDTQSPLRLSFKGIDRFPVQKSWRKLARWEPAKNGETMAVPTAMGEAMEEPVSGRAYFEHEGEEHSLLATWDNGRLFFAFADQTNRKSTYPPGRFMSAAAPEEGAEAIILDFNRAYNPPCAFTSWATCPRPVKENRLPFDVDAGELAWKKGE